MRKQIVACLVLPLLLAVQHPILPDWVRQQLANAQVRTARVITEEFHCLLGSGLFVTGVRKPEQWTELKEIEGRRFSVIHHDPCPEGTIASAHSHPRFHGNVKDCEPSETDLSVWRRPSTAHNWFIITCSLWGPNEVALSYYYIERPDTTGWEVADENHIPVGRD